MIMKPVGALRPERLHDHEHDHGSSGRTRSESRSGPACPRRRHHADQVECVRRVVRQPGCGHLGRGHPGAPSVDPPAASAVRGPPAVSTEYSRRKPWINVPRTSYTFSWIPSSCPTRPTRPVSSASSRRTARAGSSPCWTPPPGRVQVPGVSVFDDIRHNSTRPRPSTHTAYAPTRCRQPAGETAVTARRPRRTSG